MIKVQLSYDVTKSQYQSVQAMLDREFLTNINFNGESYLLEQDDFTCIQGDNSDDYKYVSLFHKIQRTITLH